MFRFKPEDFEGLAMHYDIEAKKSVASSIANKVLGRESVTRERYRQMKLKNTRLYKQNQVLMTSLEVIADYATKVGRIRYQKSFQQLLKELDELIEQEDYREE